MTKRSRGRLMQNGPEKGRFRPDPQDEQTALAVQTAQHEFLRLLWDAGSVTRSCLLARISQSTVKLWERDPEFAKRLEVVRKKLAFLESYRKFGTEYMACRHARTTTATHKRWLDEDPAYADAFGQAKVDAMDIAETELRMRGIHGHKKPVFYKGERVDTIVEKDTTALIFHLKGRRREVYGDKTEVSGAGGGPLQLQLVERLQAGRQRVAQRSLPEKATPEAMEGELVEGS